MSAVMRNGCGYEEWVCTNGTDQTQYFNIYVLYNMLYSKRRKNLRGGRKRSNRKFNSSKRGRGMRGGLPGDVTVIFDGNWDTLSPAVQIDIKSLFKSIMSRFINRDYTKFQLSGIKNSNNFDNTIAKLRGQGLNPIVLEHPK
jgi:hypothetical protein